MDSTYYLKEAAKDMFVCLLFFAIPNLTSIIINVNLTENLKDYSASIFFIMNYLCYIISFVFSLSSINNFYKHFNHHKKEPANPVRAQIKIPTQNKKEVLDKIANF